MKRFGIKFCPTISVVALLLIVFVCSEFSLTAFAEPLSRAAGQTDRNTLTKKQAALLSQTPTPSLVFHYGEGLYEVDIEILDAQADKMRSFGYEVRLVQGGPDRAVQIFIAGRTGKKLIYSATDIAGLKPMKYGMAYYNAMIGKPSR